MSKTCGKNLLIGNKVAQPVAAEKELFPFLQRKFKDIRLCIYITTQRASDNIFSWMRPCLLFGDQPRVNITFVGFLG